MRHALHRIGNLHQLGKWLDEHSEWCMDLLRFYIGVGLFIKGVYFLSNPDIIADMLGKRGFSVGLIMAGHYLALAHLAGGFFIAIGLLTRLATILQIPILIGAVFLVHQSEGLSSGGQNLEFSAFVLFALLLIMIHGSGKLSADYYIFVKKQKDE